MSTATPEQVTQDTAPDEQDEAPATTEVSLDIGAPAPEPQQGTHYSPSEVAGFLGLKSTQTVYRWVKDDKIVPAVQAGPRLIAFSREQIDDLRKLRRASSGGGSRGGKEATPNVFSEAFGNWRIGTGHSREVIAGGLTDDGDEKGMSAAQVGRWEHGFSLPTAEAMERIVTLDGGDTLAIPYIQAKAEAAREAKVARAAKKQEQADADAPTPEQAAAAATA